MCAVRLDMSMEWYRAYHHMPHDPKLKVIAKRTGQPMANVVAVWVCLLDAASQNEPRGSVQIDAEQIAVLQDIEVDGVTAIINAFYQKNLLTEQNRLTAWDKRQYSTSTERSRKFRAGKSDNETWCNVVQRDATPSNARKRRATQISTDTEEDTDNRTETETVLAEMLEIWNAKVQRKLTRDTDAILTPQRAVLLRRRWKEDFASDLKQWAHYCEVIGESDFCLGRVEGKSWTIDLSWAVESSEHVAKILEGGFSGGKYPPKPPLCLVPELQSAWEKVIEAFKRKHGGPCYRSWFTPVVLTEKQVSADGSTVVLRCPNQFSRDWIKDRYLADIKRWFADATTSDARVTGVELTTDGGVK